jgi:sugar O-acyltransferase (sialic acid O-acetyltransferase NeuD family)
MEKKLVIFGDSAFAEIAYEYFTYDSPYKVVAFTVSRAYLTKNIFQGLPVIAFEELELQFPPEECMLFIALVYNKLNRVRIQFYGEAISKGYALASYVSSGAFVWANVEIGQNCFIFEQNTIQPFVKMGDNNIIWSGNHIGHHSKIGNHNFFASHVVVSGFVEIGSANFIGVNATISNNLHIGDDCCLGSAVHIVKDLASGTFVKALATPLQEISSYDKFNLNIE